MIKKIKLWFRFNFLSLFFSAPQSFEWRTENIRKIRLWAGNRPHPHSKSHTLWDFLYDHDSCWTLRNAEIYLRNK